jgi:NAD(P)-dependent dehydrogenase (short-subunit alcohol dehydrogenase family)
MPKGGWLRFDSQTSPLFRAWASALKVAYGTSKAAIIHLTKQRPLSWAMWASALTPSRPDLSTPTWQGTQRSDTVHADAIPLMRYGTPEEITCTGCKFLCSPAAEAISMVALAVDGFDASNRNTLAAPDTGRD